MNKHFEIIFILKKLEKNYKKFLNAEKNFMKIFELTNKF